MCKLQLLDPLPPSLLICSIPMRHIVTQKLVMAYSKRRCQHSSSTFCSSGIFGAINNNDIKCLLPIVVNIKLEILFLPVPLKAFVLYKEQSLYFMTVLDKVSLTSISIRYRRNQMPHSQSIYVFYSFASLISS